jgi:phage-related protein
MALLTFTPPIPPSPGTTNKPKVGVFKAEFGDGYTLSAPAGINNIKRVLTLQWDLLSPTNANIITSFFTARLGTQPFYYTPSDESTPVKWTCEEWSDRRGKSGMRSVNCTFEQSFTLES